MGLRTRFRNCELFDDPQLLGVVATSSAISLSTSLVRLTSQ